jgi:hypothetical protein
VLDRRSSAAAVPHFQAHEILCCPEADGELPSRRDAVQQGIGRQFRDAEPYVLDQGGELPLRECFDDEVA